MSFNVEDEAAEYHVTNGQAGWITTAAYSPQSRYNFLCCLKARLLHWIDKIDEEKVRMGYVTKHIVQSLSPTCSASSIADTHLPFVGNERLERIR